MKIYYLLLVGLSFFILSCGPSETENRAMDNADSLGAEGKVSDSIIIESKTYRFALKNMGAGAEALLEWPLVVAGAPKPVMDTINKSISFEDIAGFAIEKVEEEYDKNGMGTVGSSYQINYNKKPILSLSVLIESMAAYPDVHSYHYNFNTGTGKKIQLKEIIKEDSFVVLVNKLNTILRSRVEEAIKASVESDENADIVSEQLEGEEFTETINSFTINKDGICIYYNFGFSHAYEALEPDSEFKLSWEELKPWLKPRSIVSEIIK